MADYITKKFTSRTVLPLQKEVNVLEKEKLSRAGYKKQKQSEQKKARKNEGLTNLRVIANLIRIGEFVWMKVENLIEYLREYFGDDFFL